MYFFLSILFLLLIGAICAYNAKIRGRNPNAWFAIGLLFGVIGLLILFLLPAKKTSFESSFSTVAPSPVTANPDVTNGVQPLLAPNHPSPKAQKLWYYLNEENHRFGPMSFDRLKRAWIEDQVTRETYVWNEDMEDWTPLKNLSDVLQQLGEITLPPHAT